MIPIRTIYRMSSDCNIYYYLAMNHLPVMAECIMVAVVNADIGLEECARFGDGDDDDAFRIVLVVVITGEINDAD